MSRARWIIGGIGWAAVAILAAALALGRSTGSAEPPVLAPIGAFELIDQDGRAFGSRELAGKVWIAGLAFTSCTTVCPMLTSQMGNVSRRLEALGDRVHLVTFSVDPEVDTPERLREYAARHRAPLSRWSFLTGEPQVVQRVLRENLLAAIGARVEREEGGYDILHSSRLLLVDQEGRLRGSYPTDAGGLDELVRDVHALVR